MAPWLDFDWIKDNASFEIVAQHYRLALIGTGSQRKARCPFHDDRRPSLQVNLDKQVFHCFGCGASGNVLDFVMKSEECGIRDAALRLVEICRLGLPKSGKPDRGKPRAQVSGRTAEKGGTQQPTSHHRDSAAQRPSQRSADTGRRHNAPLTFRLNLDLDAALPYLEHRGVDPDAAEEFGLGVASKGLMAGRLCIPIHDAGGNLVAYAGRFLGEPPETTEKYLLPPKFVKTLELFNLHRALSLAADYLIVVEGYFGVVRLHRLGYPVIAVMGSSISAEQINVIEATGRMPYVMMDGDEPGQRAAERTTLALATRMPTRAIALPDGEEPDTVGEEFLRDCLPPPVA